MNKKRVGIYQCAITFIIAYYHFVIFQEARDELETQKDELRDLMTKLEADRDMELEERQKLEEEIRAKQEEIERLQNISTLNFSTLKFSTPSFSTLIFKTGYNSKHKEPFKFLCHAVLLFCVQSKAVNLTHNTCEYTDGSSVLNTLVIARIGNRLFTSLQSRQKLYVESFLPSHPFEKLNFTS